MSRPTRIQCLIASLSALALCLGLASATVASGTSGPADAAPATSLQVLADFDDYVNGSLRGQGPWVVNTPGAADGAVASDDVPARLSGRALWNQLSGAGAGARYRGNAYAALGDLAVDAGATATLFLELATTRLARTGLHVGLSTDPSPGLGMDTTGDPYDLDDFGPEIVLEPRGLLARDGSVDRLLTGVTWADDATYRIWLVIDNASSRYEVHAAGEGGSRVRLSSGGRTSFSFRTPTTDSLTTFLHLNDAAEIPTGDTYLDHLALAPGGVDLSDPTPGFTAVWDFESSGVGDRLDRDGWTSSSGTRVVADPADVDNRVVRLGKGDQGLRRPVPSVAEGTTGTTFFRVRRTSDVNVSAGLSDVDDAATFGDFRSQVNSQGGASLAVRDGRSFADVGRWSSGTWQCVWLVTDNATDRVSVYSRGGPYRTTTRLPSGLLKTFGFRSATAEGLDRFLMLTDSSASPLLVDDLAVDPEHLNLRIPSGRAEDCPFAGGAQATPVTDPVPSGEQRSRVTIELTTLAQLPPAASGSTVRRANTVVAIPGSDRLAVPALEGPLYTLGATGGSRRTYLDLSEEFPDFVDAPGLGSGFGYVAYAPDFATSGRFYTVHTEAGSALDTSPPTLSSPDDSRTHGVVTEWTADDPAAPIFSGDHRQVLRVGFSRHTHGIQQIAFNPLATPGSSEDGVLYLGVGDGDETPVFSSRPGDLAAPQGKILRIDPRPATSGSAYSIPADNPYVGVPGALPEVYASGLRNPHRFSWDPVTGRLLLGNIGEKQVDAIYEVEPGDDFGWSSREGRFRFDPRDPTQVYPLPSNDVGFTYPVLQLGRDDGVALVGGFAYQGRLAALRGRYVFTDVVSGELHETSTGLLGRAFPEPSFRDIDLVVDGRRQSLSALTGGRVDTRLGQDSRGELYVISKQLGRIWAVTGATQHSPRPGSCRPRGVTIKPGSTKRDWKALHPRLWSFGKRALRLKRPGPRPKGPLRPWEYAVVRKGPELGSFDLKAEVRIDRTTRVRGRDVVLVLQHTGRRSFSYVHLSSDPGSYAHNGVFVVDRGDRRRIDDQFDGLRTPRPAITDRGWHQVRVRYCAAAGTTAVYVDGAKRPIFTATDDALAGGRVGFGSFDDKGRIRDVRIRGRRS